MRLMLLACALGSLACGESFLSVTELASSTGAAGGQSSGGPTTGGGAADSGGATNSGGATSVGGATSSGGGPASSQGGGGGGVGVQPCPGAIYDDDFQATTIDASKWNTFETNGTTSIESGHLDITIGTGVASAGVSGLSLYDFRNCSVTVEVLSVAAADDDAYTSLGLYVDASNEATAGYRGGYLYLYIKESGSEVSTGTIPYVAGKHRWWRLTEDGDITFYVSADGAAWSKVHSYATPQFLQSIRVVLTSGGQEIRNNPGTASFDNLSHSP